MIAIVLLCFFMYVYATRNMRTYRTKALPLSLTINSLSQWSLWIALLGIDNSSLARIAGVHDTIFIYGTISIDLDRASVIGLVETHCLLIHIQTRFSL